MTHIPKRAERQLTKLVRAYGTANVIGETHEIAGKRRVNPKRRSPRHELTVFDKRWLDIARRTLKMPDAMVGVMGGMSKMEAREIVRELTGAKPGEEHENPPKKARKTARRLTEIAFFKKHAGGRVGHASEGALELARAEQYANDHGWKVVWATDDDADWSWLDQPGFEKERAKEHDVLKAYLHDKDTNVLASLGGIFDPDKNYMRVIEAELALEATSRHQRRGKNPGNKAMLARASKRLTKLVRAGRKVRTAAIAGHRTLTIRRKGGTVRKANPVMGILGNPPSKPYGDQPSNVLGHVTYIEYTHGFDKLPFKHGFRPAAIAVLSADGKSIKISRRDGQRLWKLYEYNG